MFIVKVADVRNISLAIESWHLPTFAVTMADVRNQSPTIKGSESWCPPTFAMTAADVRTPSLPLRVLRLYAYQLSP